MKACSAAGVACRTHETGNETGIMHDRMIITAASDAHRSVRSRTMTTNRP